jgi:hypothetical protein
MNLLYPKLPISSWRTLALAALAGSLAAGLYGVLHDQVSYSLSPEYFTKLKFDQFHYLTGPSIPERVSAGLVGFAATWWVGTIVAWVLVRVPLLRGRPVPSLRELRRGFLVVFATSFAAAAGGAAWGRFVSPRRDDPDWDAWLEGLGVVDPAAFTLVGCLHNASYLGGVAGTFVALWRQKHATPLHSEVPREGNAAPRPPADS